MMPNEAPSLVDDLPVSIGLDLTPHNQYRWNIGQPCERYTLDRKGRQWLVARGAVLAHAGLLHDPVAQPTVGIGQIAEPALLHGRFLDVSDFGIDDALLGRIARRPCAMRKVYPSATAASERLNSGSYMYALRPKMSGCDG